VRTKARRGRNRVFIAVALVGLANTTIRDAAAQDITVRVVAGVGGVAKAERWLPVLVTVESSRPLTAAELTVTWGDARVRRDIAVPSAGRRQYDVHLRTANPEGSVRASLMSSGQPVGTAEAPIRVLRLDERVTLCVMSTDGSTAAADCTGTTTPNLLPKSIRGYDAIDHIVWPPGGSEMGDDQRVAFRRWQALRALEQSGDLGLSPQPVRPALRRGIPAPAAGIAGVVAGSYVGCLVLAGLLVTRRRASLTFTCVALVGVVATGSAVAQAIGRVGPSRAIHVHHRSVLNQIPGTDASMLSTRGVVAFPAFDRYRVSFPLRDGVIESTSSAGHSEHVIDESGRSGIGGTFGLGSRQGFTAEGIIDTQPISLSVARETLTVVNRSTKTLEKCRFAEGFSITDVGSLVPGAASSARQVYETPGPAFTCVTSDPLVGLTSPGRAVRTHGETVIAAYTRHSGETASN
jgi:hypothetical protein